MKVRTILLTGAALFLVNLLFHTTPADVILDDFQVNTEFPGHPP